MANDGNYTAVLDRIETTESDVEVPVLLLETDGDVVDEVAIERDRMPDDGRHQDAVFDVTIIDGDVQSIEYLPEETEERSEAAQSRFDELAERPPDGDDADEE